MFQNITDEDIEEEKANTNIKTKRILKEIFSFQNIFIYVITFFMSTITIKQGIIPFGLAMVGACIGSTIPIIGVYISALIGTFVGGGLSALSNFIAISVMYFVLVLVFRSKVAVDERNEIMKTGGKLFLACMIVEIVKNIKGVFLLYDLFIGTISSALVYIFYKIFVNGLVVIKEFRVKKAFTVEELIGSTIIIAVTSLAFNKLSIFSINISNVIVMFMIMLLGWKYGMMVGATCGIATGLVVSFSADSSFMQIIMFAVSGVFSGLLNRFGKIGVILGFILGNAILTYTTNGNTLVMSYFREIFIASIGLLFVPNNLNLSIKDLVGDKKLLSNIGETRLNEADIDVSNKLKMVSDMFYEMMNSKENVLNKLKEEFVETFLDNLEEIDTNIFYDEISNENSGISEEIYDCIEKNEIIVDKDLVKILTNHNNYIFMQDETIKNDLQEIIKIANRTYKMIQIEIAKEQERNKNKKVISNNLKEATKIIDECAKTIIEKPENEFLKKEKEIELLLKSKKINIKKCSIKKIKNGKFIIIFEIPKNELRLKEKDVTTNIADMLSKNLETKIVFQREKNSANDKIYTQIYSSEDKFILQVGSSKISKENMKVSGDCDLQMKLEDGKYLLAIADGMGSGEKARESSKFTIKMIKKLMTSGFEKEDSISLINSSLNLNSDAETYSSLDITVLDLYLGQAELVKSGACNTYIKNKKNVKKISSESLPVGIEEKIELKSETVNVEEGDILLMCSDGILESSQEMKKDWIEEFLKNSSTNNVQKLSDLILAEAVDNGYGIAKDDMTVIVCKIVKKR